MNSGLIQFRGVLGFWGFGVSKGFWGFGVLGFWGFGVLGFWGFGVLGFWGFGVLGRKGVIKEGIRKGGAGNIDTRKLCLSEIRDKLKEHRDMEEDRKEWRSLSPSYIKVLPEEETIIKESGIFDDSPLVKEKEEGVKDKLGILIVENETWEGESSNSNPNPNKCKGKRKPERPVRGESSSEESLVEEEECGCGEELNININMNMNMNSKKWLPLPYHNVEGSSLDIETKGSNKPLEIIREEEEQDISIYKDTPYSEQHIHPNIQILNGPPITTHITKLQSDKPQTLKSIYKLDTGEENPSSLEAYRRRLSSAEYLRGDDHKESEELHDEYPTLRTIPPLNSAGAGSGRPPHRLLDLFPSTSKYIPRLSNVGGDIDRNPQTPDMIIAPPITDIFNEIVFPTIRPGGIIGDLGFVEEEKDTLYLDPREDVLSLDKFGANASTFSTSDMGVISVQSEAHSINIFSTDLHGISLGGFRRNVYSEQGAMNFTRSNQKTMVHYKYIYIYIYIYIESYGWNWGTI